MSGGIISEILKDCRYISNEDKEVLSEALNVRRDILITRHAPKRLLPTTIEHIEAILVKVERMIDTIHKTPTC